MGKIDHFSPARPFTPTHGLWSLWDMLSLNASAFYRAATTLSAMAAAIEHWDEAAGQNKSDMVRGPIRRDFETCLEELRGELATLDCRITLMVVDRLLAGVDHSPSTLTYESAAAGFNEIQSRLQDELSLSTVFALREDRAKYFKPSDPLFGQEIAAKFPGIGYEIDEAGKCLALERSTAAVFHLMRVMETGIRAAARCLEIPDPTKPAERNWAFMLREIKAGLDAKWPNAANRFNGDGAFFESLYASLDAVRNPWRNATMHVESVYTPEDAADIFAAVRGFMRKLASRCDEAGLPHA